VEQLTTEDDARCPRCRGIFTPDQVRAAQPSATCTFCQLTVVLRRPPPEPPVAALAWPEGFVVTEIAAPASTTSAIDLDRGPYRSAAARAVQLRPGVTITWPTNQRIAKWGFTCFTAVFVTAFAVTGFVRARLSIADAPALAIYALIVGFLVYATLATWLNVTRVVADHEGLSCRIGPIWQASAVSLPVGRITQLFIVEETDSDGDRSYALFARLGERETDHKVVVLDTAEQAWWLEERLERYLGITDRPIAGEHRA
jgi:hypothetical protein